MATATENKSSIKYNRKDYDNKTLIALYERLLMPRMIEEKMLILLRQGRISKWFSGIGQEAISVGASFALASEEYLLPMHRNLGVFTGRDVPLAKLFTQFQGKKSGFSKGRDRSFHFGTNEHHIVGMISHLGPQMSIANGIALATLLNKEKKVTLAFTGDGASSEGEFHEAINVAAVWDLPVIFIVEHNGYGLSTPNREQFKFKQFTDKGPGYGIDAIQVDGNNVLEVYDTIRQTARNIRNNPAPILIEALTFRMRGHEEASGTKYVPQELFDKWEKKDPVINYEQYLLKEKVISNSKKDKIRAKIKEEIDSAWEQAFAEPKVQAVVSEEMNDIYYPHQQKIIQPGPAKSKKRFVDAISDALRKSMHKFPELVIMGQDIAEYGGVFKITQGFLDEFGSERVRNTPLCESAIIGAGLGLSIKNKKAVVEMQFADFVTCGFNQIINNLAKIHYRWGQNADVVVRMPTGAGVGAGPFHSQSNEAWFFHTPGLKIVYPSNPRDAKGMLNAAIEDPNPYMYFEHKALYRSLTDEIEDDYFTIEVGKASLYHIGDDVSIITYGMGVHWASKVVKELELSADILDLRTLLPWDKEAVEQTVKKTGKVIVLHEDCLTGGIAGEISAWIAEHCFEHLDAPIARVASIDTPVPFAASLEEQFLPMARLKEKVIELLAY